MRADTLRRDTARIVNDVRERGDAALREWAQRLDDAGDGPFAVSKREIDRGWKETPSDVKRAIRVAIRNVRAVAERQVPRPFTVRPVAGVRIDQVVQPLSRVGCYVPGGRYPLPSTLIMTVVPALAAGVPEVVVACPRPAAVVLCAAREAGATSVLRIGGAQAIAALAYGTQSIPRVNKIVGPGNAWVAAAKSLVAADCPIDFEAGPSEIVIYANTGSADWIASDLIAQAEHDPDARAIFVTTNKALAQQVKQALAAQTPSTGPAAASLARNGQIIVKTSARAAIAAINAIAPEHLVIDPDADVTQFRAAGTIFVGPWSAQAAGDYTTGSNHVLPTSQAARFRGGLSAADFVRVFTVQTLTRRGIRAIGPAAATLADAEGLSAHADSIRRRL
ncbi:MAG: histidinol dehydrogenase [Acidobacteriota bacterium]